MDNSLIKISIETLGIIILITIIEKNYCHFFARVTSFRYKIKAKIIHENDHRTSVCSTNKIEMTRSIGLLHNHEMHFAHPCYFQSLRALYSCTSVSISGKVNISAQCTMWSLMWNNLVTVCPRSATCITRLNVSFLSSLAR